jgi:hypothetical protein
LQTDIQGGIFSQLWVAERDAKRRERWPRLLKLFTLLG